MIKMIQWAAMLALALVAGPGMAQTVEYMHTDALGSVVAITDSTGAVIERNQYEPYGEDLTGIKDGPGYTGHVSDAATELSYMQQRYYDPTIGRLLSVDPVTAEGGDMRHFNRYAYAYNNPYTFNDPDGRCPNCVTGGVGAGIGLIVGLGMEGYRQYKAGEFNGRSLLVEGTKGAVVGGLIGLTGGAAAAPELGLTMTAQAAATGSVGLGVGAGANTIGEMAKGNPAPSANESINAGYATGLAAAAGPALAPIAKSATTTTIAAESSHPVTSLSGRTFNTVNVPAQSIERPVTSELVNGAMGSTIEEISKK